MSVFFFCIVGNIIMINDNLVRIILIENLIGVDGWCLLSFIYSYVKMGVKMMINNGFNDWN